MISAYQWNVRDFGKARKNQTHFCEDHNTLKKRKKDIHTNEQGTFLKVILYWSDTQKPSVCNSEL